MFTANVRQAFEFPDRLKGATFRQLYEYTRLPLSCVFGGFPVKVWFWLFFPQILHL